MLSSMDLIMRAVSGPNQIKRGSSGDGSCRSVLDDLSTFKLIGSMLSASLAGNNRARPTTTMTGLMSKPIVGIPSLEAAYVVVPLPFQGSSTVDSEERPDVFKMLEANASGKPA
jgi:hypothetical protein